MGLLSKATHCSVLTGFGGNSVHRSQAHFWQHGSMQGEWKLKSGISSDSCHLGRKIYFGPNGRASRAPTTQSSSRMKRHRGSNLRSSEPDRIVGTTWRVPLTHTDTHVQTIRKPFPVLFLILLFFLFLIIPCYNWVLKKVSKLSVWATGFFKVSNLSETENIIKK